MEDCLFEIKGVTIYKYTIELIINYTKTWWYSWWLRNCYRRKWWWINARIQGQSWWSIKNIGENQNQYRENWCTKKIICKCNYFYDWKRFYFFKLTLEVSN